MWTNSDCKCNLAIPSFTASNPTINAGGGETVTLAAELTETSGQGVRWTLNIAGASSGGSGKSVRVPWDGKDGSGRILENGLYTAILQAETEDGQCGQTATLPIRVENYSSCALEIQFGSTANLATGNLSHQELLFAASTPGLTAAITFYYNSLDNHNGPLGLGWSHSYEIALRKQNDGSMLLRNGNGRRLLYRFADGGYQAPAGDYSTLTSGNEGYLLTAKDGTRFFFNPSGRLTAIMDRNDNAMRFGYDEALTTITDPVGRVTRFHLSS